jgi:hypothetical protein
MDYIRFVENLVAIHVATLETQIQSIKMFSRPRFPTALAEQTKMLAGALLRSLETIEQQFVEDVEQESEGILGKFVEFTRTLETVGENLAHDAPEASRRLAEIAKKGHRSLTSALSQEEIKLTSDIAERFKKMKEKVGTLIKQLDSL